MENYINIFKTKNIPAIENLTVADISTCIVGGFNPYEFACISGHLEVLEILFKKIGFLSHHEKYLGKMIFLAVNNGRDSILKFLLKHNIRNDYNPGTGFSILHYAAVSGNVESINALISAGYYVNLKSENKTKPLLQSLIFGKIEAVKCLVDHGASFDSFDMYVKSNKPKNKEILDFFKSAKPKTNIFLAYKNGDLDYIKKFIIDVPRFKINGGLNHLHIACYHRCEEIVDILLSTQPSLIDDTDDNNSTIVHYAANSGNLSILKKAIDHCSSNINQCNYNGITPLHYASSKGHIDVVKFLLSLDNININESGTPSKTPIRGAIENEHFDVIKLLATHGAEIDDKDEFGKTAIDCAKSNEVKELLKKIIRFKDSIFSPNIDLNLLKKLFSEGLDLNQRNHDGRTLLHKACLSGNKWIIKFLLNNNIDVNIKDNRGRTALHLTCLHNRVDIMKMIIEKGANLELKDNCLAFYSNVANDENSPLHLCCYRNSIECAKLLISKGANLNLSNETDGTPLMISAMIGNFNMVELLLQKGAKVNEPDNYDDYTPIYSAVEGGNLKIVKILVEYGARLDRISFDYDTPLMAAEEKEENEDIIEYLSTAEQKPDLNYIMDFKCVLCYFHTNYRKRKFEDI